MTRARVASATWRELRNTRDTVIVDVRARAATAAKVEGAGERGMSR